jgi:hypothetical protein
MITFYSSIILPVVVLFPQKLNSPLFLNEIYDNSFFELLTLPEKLSSNENQSILFNQEMKYLRYRLVCKLETDRSYFLYKHLQNNLVKFVAYD